MNLIYISQVDISNQVIKKFITTVNDVKVI